MLTKNPGVERHADDGADGHAKIVAELKAFSNEGFSAGTLRMGVIEASIEKHSKLLEDNTKLTIALGDRFDSFETAFQVETRLKDVSLAKGLDKWKDFMILKVDEATAENKVIKDNQALHMKATEELRASIGTILGIVSTVEVVKDTASRFGRCGMWLGTRIGKMIIGGGAVAAGWLALMALFTSGAKFKWPFV